ncbi:hypothetical protein ACFE04_001223 [Oxalis oulophora]
MKPWNDLGIVDTIYEDEDYDINNEYKYYSSSSSSNNSSSLSLTPSPSSSLNSRVKAWSMATGREVDVSIYVQGTCFNLHKDPLALRSTYLRRHLTDVDELTLSPPLNISPETFTIVADFCYGSDIVITPFNIAALRTAAEILKMTGSTSEHDSFDNLGELTETYFRKILAVNGRDYVLIVFRYCLSLLPEAETEALMVSRCIEALSLRDDGDGDGIFSFVEELIALPPEEFQIVADSMQRVTFHDVVYRIVDCYIKEQGSNMKEEQKTQICNSIDCNRLSPDLLFHAVQNPRMPLRFVVRAMLIEQLKTRRAIVSATTTSFEMSPITTMQKPRPRRHSSAEDTSSSVNTLGAILKRDAARHQEEKLKATMEATSSRIQKLEKELRGMKLLLLESDKERNNNNNNSRNILDSVRSASFHYGTKIENSNINGKIKREEKRSVSFRFGGNGKADGRAITVKESPKSVKKHNNIGMKLISGLRGAFKSSNN